MTIYYETARDGLVPVEFVGWCKTPAHEVTELYNAVLRVKRAGKGYLCRELIYTSPQFVVEKAGRKDYCQLVRNVVLPVRDITNTIDRDTLKPVPHTVSPRFKSPFGMDVELEIIRNHEHAQVRIQAPMYMNKVQILRHSYGLTFTDQEILRDGDLLRMLKAMYN